MKTFVPLAALAVGLALAAGSSPSAAQDENPTTPGAIPNPGSYQGSMELQRQSDQQDQQFRQQQREQPSYQQPRYGGSSGAYGPRAQGQRGYATRSNADAGSSPQNKVHPFGRKSPQDLMADQLTARGDYAGAVRIWRPLAERGDVNAQYGLAVMYELGRGVPMSKAQAAALYRRAADRGYAAAMVNLAYLIVSQARTSAQLVPAYTWVRLALKADQDPGVVQTAQYDLHFLAPKMSRAQIGQAERAAFAWRPH